MNKYAQPSKTEAFKLLEQHFSGFKCSASFGEISFLYELQPSGDEIPLGFILSDFERLASALFIRENNAVVFYGFFQNPFAAHDYACDHFIIELYKTPFCDLSDEVTPVDFTAPQQEPSPVPASAPAEGQLFQLSTESVDKS